MVEKHRNIDSIEDSAARWLARRDGDGWTAEAQRQLEMWLDEDVHHRVAYLRLDAYWQAANALTGQPAARAQPAAPVSVLGWRTLARQPTWRVAAGLVVACSLGALLTFSGGSATERYATRVGESRAIALADGSRIVLNTATRLRATRDGARHVWLDVGEAYFDVFHDAAHPFVIEAGSSRVTVLGTRFVVRRDGATTTVLVAQGRVRVADAGKAVELVRNEEATARAGDIARAKRTPVETEQKLAWRDGRLMFDGTTLADAVAEFNRYNERQLLVVDPVVGGIAIGGSFAPTNVDGFVRLLEKGFALHAERRGNTIAISR